MGRAENIVGKGENAGDQHNVFKKHFSVGLLKVVLVWQRVEHEQIKIICKSFVGTNDSQTSNYRVTS